MKRFIIAILLVCFALILSACGGTEETPTTQASTTAAKTQDPVTTAAQTTEASITTAVSTTASTSTTAAAQTTVPATTTAPVTTEHVHSFGEWKTVTEATCVAKGLQERECSVCKAKETQEIDATGVHSFGEWKTVKEATCGEKGQQERECSVCKEKETQDIAATGEHSFGAWETVTEESCTEKGTEERECSVCGAKETQEIDALGHDPDENNVCKRCGRLIMTDQEQKNAAKVDTMSHSLSESYSYFDLSISFKDASSYSVSSPAIVDVRIVNASGVTVLEKTYVKTQYSSHVYIYYSDITSGIDSTGILYYTVYNPGYFTFSEVGKDVGGLPWTVSLELPTLPHSYSYKLSSGTVSSTCEAESISYEVSGDDLVLTIVGKKTYDKNGAGQSSSCKISYKLYDSEGFVVKSGTIYTQSVAVGDKFKVTQTLYDCLEPGKTYRLEFLDTN